MPTIGWVIIAIYLAIGLYSFNWIRIDAEFRTGPWLLLGLLAVILWPIMLPIWMAIRGKEHLTDMAARQSPRDFQIYRKTTKRKDLFADLPQPEKISKQAKSNAANAPSNKKETAGSFTDHNIERLMANHEWVEAEAAAREMLKFSAQNQDNARTQKYEEYIRRIEDARRMEME
jgi:hypothetical protein